MSPYCECLLAQEAAYRLVSLLAEECSGLWEESEKCSVCVYVCSCSSAVENGSVPVWSEWEHRTVRVSLPSVGTQRSNGLEDNTHIGGC